MRSRGSKSALAPRLAALEPGRLDAVERSEEAQVLRGRQLRIEGQLLRHQADLPLQCSVAGMQAVAVDADLAGGRTARDFAGL